MARGKSGRIVVEVNPNLKGDLYAALEKDGLTFKDWLLTQTGRYLAERDQMQLFEAPATYNTKESKDNQ